MHTMHPNAFTTSGRGNLEAVAPCKVTMLNYRGCKNVEHKNVMSCLKEYMCRFSW